MENFAALDIPELEADHGQFKFPDWTKYYMRDEAEKKKLGLTIQKAARMEARAREIRAKLSKPEARTIINLIKELKRLESDPLGQELEGIMDKLKAAKEEYDSAFSRLYPGKEQHYFVTRLMKEFGLSATPQIA